MKVRAGVSPEVVGDLLMVATFGGISLSRDLGRTWQHQSKNLGDATRGLADSHVFFDIQTDGEKMVVGSHHDGLSITWDAGVSWRTVNNGYPGFPSDHWITSVDVKGDYVLIGTLNGGVGLSSDQGLTWFTMDNTNGLPSNSVHDVDFH